MNFEKTKRRRGQICRGGFEKSKYHPCCRTTESRDEKVSEAKEVKNVTSDTPHTHTHTECIPLGGVKEGKYRLAGVGQWESKPQKSPGENSWSTSPVRLLPPSTQQPSLPLFLPQTFCNFLFLSVFIAASPTGGKKSPASRKADRLALSVPDFPDFFFFLSLLRDTSCSEFGRACVVPVPLRERLQLYREFSFDLIFISIAR